MANDSAWLCRALKEGLHYLLTSCRLAECVTVAGAAVGRFPRVFTR